MDIQDLLAQAGGLSSMARELGVSEQEAANGAASLLPAILGGFKKQTQAQPQGLAGLGGLLGTLGGGDLLDDLLSSKPTSVGRGNAVLGKIFGSKDVSRAVAQNASTQSGLSPDVLKKMLPMLAMMVTGFLAKKGGADTAPAQAAEPSGGGLGGLLGGLMGGRGGGGTGGLASLLDLDGDGNPLDDILGMAGGGRR